MVGEDRGHALSRHGLVGQVRQAVAEKDVVAQDEAGVLPGDVFFRQQKGLGQAFGPGLLHIVEAAAPLASIVQQGPVEGQMLRRGNEADIPDARHHERGQRVVDHGLVVDGHELFAHAQGQRIEPRPGPAGQDDALPVGHDAPPWVARAGTAPSAPGLAAPVLSGATPRPA